MSYSQGVSELDTIQRLSTQVIYNVALVSGVQQSESVIQKSTLFMILFHIGHYRIRRRDPWAT